MPAHTFQLDSGQVTLTGDRWPGDPDRLTVLLLHGGGQTRHSWDRTATRLSAEGWTTVSLDARGHGDSDWHPDGDYSLDGFVGDLLTFCQTLERPPVLVGASLGGIAALVAAGEHPGLAAGLVLVDVVVTLEAAGVKRIQSFLTAHTDGFDTLEDVAAAIEAYNPVRKRARNLDGVRKNVRQRADGRWYWHWDPVFIANDDEPRRRAARARLRAAAANLEVPTLIVRGGQSDVVSDDGLADMLALVPHAQAIEVNNAAHMVAGDDNDIFADTLAAFLERCEQPASEQLA